MNRITKFIAAGAISLASLCVGVTGASAHHGEATGVTECRATAESPWIVTWTVSSEHWKNYWHIDEPTFFGHFWQEWDKDFVAVVEYPASTAFARIEGSGTWNDTKDRNFNGTNGPIESDKVYRPTVCPPPVTIPTTTIPETTTTTTTTVPETTTTTISIPETTTTVVIDTTTTQPEIVTTSTIPETTTSTEPVIESSTSTSVPIVASTIPEDPDQARRAIPEITPPEVGTLPATGGRENARYALIGFFLLALGSALVVIVREHKG